MKSPWLRWDDEGRVKTVPITELGQQGNGDENIVMLADELIASMLHSNFAGPIVCCVNPMIKETSDLLARK